MDLNYATAIAVCVSACAAVVALVLSVRQIRLSNRQSLFNRKLSIWLTAQGLLALYKENQNLLKKKDEPQLSVDLILVWFTNNLFLCEAGLVASCPLDTEKQKLFLAKLDELNSLSVETKFVFKGEPAVAISNFITDYKQLLFSLYQYQVLIANVLKNAQQFFRTLEKSCEEIDELSWRNELYVAYDSVSKSYKCLSSDKMIRLIEKQIRLIS